MPLAMVSLWLGLSKNAARCVSDPHKLVNFEESMQHTIISLLSFEKFYARAFKK